MISSVSQILHSKWLALNSSIHITDLNTFFFLSFLTLYSHFPLKIYIISAYAVLDPVSWLIILRFKMSKSTGVPLKNIVILYASFLFASHRWLLLFATRYLARHRRFFWRFFLLRMPWVLLAVFPPCLSGWATEHTLSWISRTLPTSCEGSRLPFNRVYNEIVANNYKGIVLINTELLQA